MADILFVVYLLSLRLNWQLFSLYSVLVTCVYITKLNSFRRAVCFLGKLRENSQIKTSDPRCLLLNLRVNFQLLTLSKVGWWGGAFGEPHPPSSFVALALSVFDPLTPKHFYFKKRDIKDFFVKIFFLMHSLGFRTVKKMK